MSARGPDDSGLGQTARGGRAVAFTTKFPGAMQALSYLDALHDRIERLDVRLQCRPRRGRRGCRSCSAGLCRFRHSARHSGSEV